MPYVVAVYLSSHYLFSVYFLFMQVWKILQVSMKIYYYYNYFKNSADLVKSTKLKVQAHLKLHTKLFSIVQVE